MGIFGALNNAVSGLQSQAYALEQISGNIANSQTVGYKRAETSFADMVADAAPSRQAPGGVTASTRATNDVQGSVQRSDVETFMAIQGDGYFVVAQQIGEVDNRPVFDDTDAYTRRGDFEIDRSGYLVNGAGYFLQGLPIDPTTGNPSRLGAGNSSNSERLLGGAANEPDRLPRQLGPFPADCRFRPGCGGV
jgi:flagellar hook protein FlgE